MRPLHVLSLVIVAVAVLLFALFTLDGGTDPEPPVVVDSAPEVQPEPTPPAQPANVSRPQDEQSSPVVADSRRALPTGDVRKPVASAKEHYDNSLAGFVVDPDGLAVEGADLLLTEGGIESGMREIQRAMGTLIDTEQKTRSTKTNEEGRFSFSNLEPGDYSLVTKHEEFSEHLDSIVPIGMVGETPWDIALEEGVMLHGYVRSIEGGPIAGATLTLSSSMTPGLMAPKGARKPENEYIVLTDPEGYYRLLNLTPGESWHLSASAGEYGTQTERNLLIEETVGTNTVDFRLQPGESLSGRVIAPDRSPIKGASVRVVGYQQPQTLSADAVTDGEGRFTVSNLVSGNYTLIAESDGWRTERLNRVEAPSDDIEIQLAEQGTVMGRVVGASGEAVPSFTLSLHQYIANSSAYGRRVMKEKMTSKDGSFTMNGIDEGQFSIKVAAAGYADTFSEDFEVTQGLTTTDILIKMSVGGTITGLVLDSTTGEPLSGAIVTTQDNNYQDNPLMRMFGASMPRRTTQQRTLTGKDGRFELNMLAPELYQVRIQHPSFPLLVLDNQRVVEGAPTDIGSIRLEPGSTIRGTVYDGAGSPLSGATISILSTAEDLRTHLEGRTNSEGRYILRNVPEGSYRMTAQRPTKGGDPFGPIVDMKNSEIQIKVGRGQEYTQDLNLGGRGQ